MIGFDINELNQDDYEWIALALRELLETFENTSTEYIGKEKEIKEIRHTLRKVAVKIQNLQNKKASF